MTKAGANKRGRGIEKRQTSAYERHGDEWYIEPIWTAQRIFDVENFFGSVLDPCCGTGQIVMAARAIGIPAQGMDIRDRGFPGVVLQDFFSADPVCSEDNIVTNPPFDMLPQFITRACTMVRRKVAVICPAQRLNAAHPWLTKLPLARVWLLSPRPSMPPGDMLLSGEIKAQGGYADFAWLVFDMRHRGAPALRWLTRDLPEVQL